MSDRATDGARTHSAQEVGARIRMARKASGMSVALLARRIGVEAASMKAWEKGEREPRANRLRMLSGLLNVPLAWLLDGRDPEPLGPPVLTVHALRQRVERARLLLAEGMGLLEEIEASLAALDQSAEVAEPDGGG